MNVKKSLENRIRGWFPKEPYLISTRVKVDSEAKQHPLVIPPGYDVSAAKVAGWIAIFWTILGPLLLIQNGFQNHFSLASQGAWIIAGLAIGLSLGTLHTRRQLNKLSKDYKISTSGKETLLLVSPIIIFFILGIFINIVFYGFTLWIRGPAFFGYLTAIYILGVSYLIVRFALFSDYEKKENMCIMQSWVGGFFIVIPKAPKQQALQN